MMKQTIKTFLALLALLVSSTGAWAQEPTAYAVLTDNTDGDGTKTLTFKYEVHTVSGDNEWDVSNTGGVSGYNNPGWFNKSSNITRVVFDPSFADARPRSCKNWFYACGNLTAITGIEYLNTSEVTNMEKMFMLCSSLKSLDVSHFNTSNVTNMNKMFYWCGPANLDLSSFNTSKVTNMGSMFSMYSKLKTLTIGKDFTVGSGTNTDEMFYATSINTLYIKGTIPPSIAKDIFVQEGEGSYKIDNCNLATEMTAATLGATGPDGDGKYAWKGGTFVSVGKVNVSYVDEDGNAQTIDAMPLISSTTALAAGWYYVEGDVTINNKVVISGNIDLILCDGATLTINSTTSGIKDTDYDDLKIYSQSKGSSMGKLVINSQDASIDCCNVSIYGGDIHLGCTYGIKSSWNVVIDGGIVTATGLDGDGIYAANNVTINGGKVTATGSAGHYGINAGGTITLGFTAQSDFILANSYNGTVKTAAGKGFSIAGGGTLDGGIALDASQKTAIAGKKLTPVTKVRVGTDHYSTLQGALEYVKTQSAGTYTITLLDGYDLDESASYIDMGTTHYTITIDLNGKSVKYQSLGLNDNLTIKNGTWTGQTINNTNGGNAGTLTLNNASVTCTSLLQWMANDVNLVNSTLTLNSGNDTPVNFNTGGDDWTLTMDTDSKIAMTNCSVYTWGGAHTARTLAQLSQYALTGTSVHVDEMTNNTIELRGHWGLLLSNSLSKATVDFWVSATEPTSTTVFADGDKTNLAEPGEYVVMHIVPNAGYWTNQELLFAMETGATLAPSMRAPGLDLGQVPTLLKADEGYSNGAGWYYYQIPAGHSVDAGYVTSTIDGFVVPKFDLSAATASADGKTLTVASSDWNTTISIDENSFTYNGTAQGPQLSGTTMQIKKGTDNACTLPLSGNVSLSGNSLTDVGYYNATLSADANSCFSNSKAVDFNIYRTLALFSGSNTWATYVAQEDLALPAGLTAYIVTGVNDNSVATMALTYIPKDVAILLQRTDNTNNSYKAYAGTGTDDVSDNKLVGSATAATDIQTHKDYVLYNDRFELAGVSSVGAGKAYLPATALNSTAAPSFLSIGETTSLGSIENGELRIENYDMWYTLDGRKLNGKPTKKGLYIYGGKKQVVR